MDRRHFLGLGAAVAAAPFVNLRRYRLFASQAATYSARAIDLVGATTTIDMLSPFSIGSTPWLRDPASFTADDRARFEQSGLKVFHPAVGLGGVDAYGNALRFFASWNGFIAHHADWLMRVDSAATIDRVRPSGKIGVILGLQNSQHFRTLDDVTFFHSIGQRVSQLTYNSRNMIGNGSTERRDEGLSDFGVAVVGRMNEVRMAVDVSHCGDRTTLDAFEVSKQPVLITHSNCRALVPGHPRCKTDEAIRAMAKSGSVMGITGVRMFVKDAEPTTIEDMLDHYDHVRDLVGVEHLGLGSDMDLNGYDDMPPDVIKQMRVGYKGSYGFRE
ncbi:MAG: dipeptidase, partial [Vicinamibacterales bacterium]